MVAAAIVDRLLHSDTVLNIRGASYRTRVYVDQQKLKGGGAMVWLTPEACALLVLIAEHLS